MSTVAKQITETQKPGVDYGAIFRPKKEVVVIKKDGTRQPFNVQKVIEAVQKSAYRALTQFTEEEKEHICKSVVDHVDGIGSDEIHIATMHNIVEAALEEVRPIVAKSYRDYRDYKQDFVAMLDDVYKRSQSIMYIGDKENSNTDSALVSTKRSLIFNQLNKDLYQKFFMTTEELQACREGYIYVHDMSARRDTMNCFSRSTRFITDRGVKSFYDFSEGDTVNVLSHKGIWRKATVHAYGYQQLQTVIFKRNGSPKEVLVTANHRWPLKDGSWTTELKVGDKLAYTPDITDFDFEELSRENQKLWCLGFAFGDGSAVMDNNIPIMHVRLCGDKIRYADYFEAVGYSVTYPESLNGDGMVRMTDVHVKEFPYLQINKDNVRYFMNGFMAADGNRNREGRSSEYRGVQVTGDFNNIVYDLLNMSGYYVTSTKDLTGQETNYGVRIKNTISYQTYSNCGDKTWKVAEIKPAYINGREKVWCLDVEEDHSFLLEGGIPTGNCCLADISGILKGGFEMGNVWYNEPKTLDTAFDVISDLVLSMASQQYGGFTLPEVDKILEPYAEKSLTKYVNEYMEKFGVPKEKAELVAMQDIQRDFEQGFQGWEYKFNTVASSRGDYPFITVTAGLATGRFGKMASITMLNVRKKGQGKKGHKKPVLFPKIVFLYDENLHGPGKELEDVFDAGVACSMKTMYPDWLSLTGEGYVPSMYKKYGKVVSPMGCVDGQEIITYKFRGQLYVESFKRMWDRLAQVFEVKQQPAGPGYNYMDVADDDVLIFDKKKRFVKTQRVIRNTSSKWVDLHLSNGRRLLCTTDHPITTADDVTKHACELEKGEKLIINSEQYSEEAINFDTDKAWLLGFILCDGCYSSNAITSSIALDSEDDIEEKYHELFPKYFDMETRTITQLRGAKGNYKDLRAYSNGKMTEVIKYLTNEFGGVGKKDRQIPNEVFSWKREAKLAFMAGMIDADGYFNRASHGGTVVQIGSTNKELALQQMALAQALGMPAKIYYNKYNKEEPGAIRYRIEFFATKELAKCLVCGKKKSGFKGRSACQANAQSGDINDIAEVISVETVSKTDYSYDVTTSSSHFDVSGIWSHNCRAFLSPWYERGGMEPADEDDKPVFVGRFNIGAVSLHLPMILAKARQEGRDFYEVLDYYLNLIRQLHIRTYAYLGELRASTNPLGYCEGGFYGGHLGLHDKIKPLLKPMTASFGITALNELQELYNHKSLVEDGQFALEVMEYINKEVNRFKKEDGYLYAIYGTPAENLCGLQITQFREKYGIVEGVSDREYVSNSFHCHVTEDITPIEKQDLEYRFWNLFNGGKIQYVRYPINYNVDAVKALIRRAMDMGLYEGVNMSLAYCDDCGHEELDMDVCPECGSTNLTKIDRMNGYLSYSRVHGDTRLNAAKMAEIAERKSM